MPSGRPDWNAITVMSGKYGSDFLPVLLDALGQLYAVLRGDYSGTPATVALDSAGRILAHLIGLDGSTPRDVALDASGNLNARLKGYDGSTLRDVKVDDTGQIMALLRGMYGSTLKTIAVDTDGVMKANLSAQDFDFLRVRPVYGQAQALISNPLNIPNTTWGTLANVSGRGATVCGGIFLNQGASGANNVIDITVDGTQILYESFSNLWTYGSASEWIMPIRVTSHNDTTFEYLLALRSEITFEASFSWTLFNGSGEAIYPYRYLYYALVPT